MKKNAAVIKCDVEFERWKLRKISLLNYFIFIQIRIKFYTKRRNKNIFLQFNWRWNSRPTHFDNFFSLIFNERPSKVLLSMFKLDANV